MKKLIAAVLSAVLVSSCITTSPEKQEAYYVQDLFASTVQIEARVEATLVIDIGFGTGVSRVIEVPLPQGWTGSGVVYDKVGGLTEPIRSKILTANHVLETHKPGTVVPVPGGYLKFGKAEFLLHTHDGRTCELEPLVLGENTTRDVATALAYCDAGPAAELATQVPVVGSRIMITGHPLGIEVAIATEGFVSGWYDGYLLVSAGAAPGNSGGPVWYRGKVIGLLVRGASSYPNISLVTPLNEVLDRVEATP
jgi:S1-C subfamily serine protease